jgi:hypothetical protein
LPDKLTRSIVVITDGGDSNFYSPVDDDLRGKKKSSIKDFLEAKFTGSENPNSKIQISVIGYEVNKESLRDSPAELKGYKDFKPALDAIKGVYFNAENESDLAESLKRSLMQMFFQVYPAGESSEDVQGQNISRSHEPPRWVPRPPSEYRIRVPSIRSLAQHIYIRPGDSLLLDLMSGPNEQPVFRRSMYAKGRYITQDHFNHKSAEVKDWLLAALQNEQLAASNRLNIMATLEKAPDLKNSPRLIEQVHPKWAWYEILRPEGSDRTLPLHVTPLPDYPAPAWGIEVLDWPLERPAPTLKAWWTEQILEAHGQLLKGPHFKESLLELGNRSWPLPPQMGKVTLESVGLEKCRVKVGLDRSDELTDCLVVRLSYPPDKEPFFVRLPERKGKEYGMEERFYAEAGKYTGIFWSVTKEDARMIDRLDLFSVAELKKTPLRVEKLDLGQPNSAWKRPPSARGTDERPYPSRDR